ncbi:HAD hydrolase-like protein [Paenibacillus sp. BR1-192]|uniref:HAD hydrolase-like protein n=1 Tax=Paenibacillus sp. BR1-192 TaxID=3032287 RepID=UPI00240DA6EB|nr:HAD hydrolase-like protein [Paenibacillus sp. BR1-192]WFB58115.1 HAD hydrolase-like protein [Paenibacillus sp. BR1-192]
MDNLVERVLRENKTVVFFDVFDTILYRKVDPEYVKKIWAKRISVELGGFLDYSELYSLRQELEVSICQSNADSGLDLEFNYLSMIKLFHETLIQKKMIQLDNDYNDFLRKCVQVETEVELGVQYVDNKWINTVNELKKHDIKIYCVSDFYLTKEIMDNLLVAHNLYDSIDKLYVSSEYLLTKRSGRLYELIINRENMNPSEILMIGDNKHSDFDVPTSLGIDAIHLNRIKQHEYYREFREKVGNLSYYRKELDDLSRKMMVEGKFFEIACSLFYFIASLHKNLLKSKVKNVFFFSREGEFLLKLFDLYQDKEGFFEAQRVKAHYLKVSRKATFIPSLQSLDKEKFDVLFRQYVNISVYDFLSSLNFDEDIINQISEKLNIELYTTIHNFPESEYFTKLINHDLFSKTFESIRTEQKKNFCDYLKQFNVEIKEGLSIVDVGWKGTIQDNLFKILDKKIRVEGYYLGLIAPGDASKDNVKHGVLFSSIPSRTPFFNVFNENRALYEVLLGASHGSANKYVTQKKSVEVETFQTEKEKELFETIISPLQSSIFEWFGQLCDIFCKKDINHEILIEHFAKIHARMIFFPTKTELEFFNGLYHYENFGVFKFSTFNIEEGKHFNLNRTIKNSLSFFKNPRGILDRGFWGPITLKSEGLGYLIPLYGRYKYYKTFRNNKDYSEKNDSLLTKELKKTLAEQQETIQKMTKMIDDRDTAIKNMTKMIDDRDAAIKSMTKMIDERDSLIASLSKRMQEE